MYAVIDPLGFMQDSKSASHTFGTAKSGSSYPWLGQYRQSLSANPNDAPAPHAVPGESILGLIPWFQAGDEMLLFDAEPVSNE